MPPPPDHRDRDSMLDLPLRPGDRQTELPFDADSMRPTQGRPQRPPVSRRPPARRRRGRKGVLWLALAVVVGALLVFLIFWPKPPEAGFSADPFVLSAVRVGASGAPEAVSITNVGERPMPIEMVRLIGGDVDDFLLSEERCGATILEPLASCEVQVEFRPAAMGLRETVLEVAADMPESPARLAVRGEGTAPVMVIDPPQAAFGRQDVGVNSEPLDLIVSNQGTAPMEIRRVALAGAAERDYRLTRNECSKASLDPGQSCALRLVFIPRASGQRQANLVIDSDALEPLPAAGLSGEGVWTGAAFAVEPQAVDFGSQLVGAAPDRRSIQVVNRQGAALRGIRVELRDAAPGFRLAGQGCSGRTLAPGEGCQVQVGFAPLTEGDVDGVLEIGHPDVGTLGIGLRGRGVAPRWVSGTAVLEFGAWRVGERGSAQAMELQNEGSAGAEVEGVELAGEDRAGFALTDDRCSGRQSEPGAGCSVRVEFAPRREGEHRAGLRFHVAAGAEPGIVNLMGRAIAPRLSLDREMVGFDRVHRTTQSQVEIALSNPGTAPLRLGAIALAENEAGQYRVLGGSCLGLETLAPAAVCSVSLGFSPTTEGRSTARLEIEHDGISGPRAVPLSGVGLPPPIPKLVLDQSLVDFGPQPVGNRSPIETIEVRAGGTGNLILREFTLEGEHPADFVIVPATCHAGPSLLPGTACAVGVRFVPSTGGPRSARLVLRHNAGTGVDRVELRGEGMGGPPG